MLWSTLESATRERGPRTPPNVPGGDRPAMIGQR